MNQLTFAGGLFVFRCELSLREMARRAGFLWDAPRGVCYTRHPVVAARLRKFADVKAEEKLNQSLIQLLPWSAPLPLLSANGLDLKSHQIEAAKFSLTRNRSYLRLDPGLGKTPVAAVVARALGLATVYVTPPFLITNIEEEFRRWACGMCLDIYGREIFDGAAEILIVPDSLLVRPTVVADIKRWLNGRAGLLIVDEAHRFKSMNAKRTKALLDPQRALADLFSRQIYMSGTPMPNRPVELFPLLTKVAPETIDFMDFFAYAKKYCAAYQGPFGWDFSGASNMAELERRVIAPTGPFMLRQKKELLGLPPKIEEVFVVAANMTPRLARMDRGLGSAYRSIEDMIRHRLGGGDDLHTMTYRRLLGLEKVAPSVHYIEAVLEEGDEALLVFAYHNEVIEALTKALSKHHPSVITGQTPSNKRQELVKSFQNSKTQRLFIGNYLAMGVGFTLTKATRVLFVEFDWVPATNEQAADRVHRIGQNKSVLIQYVVYKDSIDKSVCETILKKRAATAHI